MATSNDGYASNTAYAVSRSYAANGLNQYRTVGERSYAYDLNGNLTSDGERIYVYDSENRLVSARSAATGAPIASLSYDPLGRLWQVSGPQGTTSFLYDGDRLIEERGGSGQWLRLYAHGPGTDEPLVWYELTGGPVRRYLHADHQGSVVASNDDGGNVVGLAGYDAWGIPNSTSLTNVGRLGYTGQAWLPELGMWHYKARIYSPTLGRFLQTDPVGYEGGLGLYGYVNNDPVNHTDPSGEEAYCVNNPQGCTDNEPITWRKVGIGLLSLAATIAPGLVPEAVFLARAPALTQLAAALAEGLAPGSGYATTAGSAAAGLMLAKRLSIEAQLGQIAAGRGSIMAGAGAPSGRRIRDIERLVQTYGGKPSEWQKVSGSSSRVLADGSRVQVHAYRNVATGKVVEQKAKQEFVSCTGTRLCHR